MQAPSVRLLLRDDSRARVGKLILLLSPSHLRALIKVKVHARVSPVPCDLVEHRCAGGSQDLEVARVGCGGRIGAAGEFPGLSHPSRSDFAAGGERGSNAETGPCASALARRRRRGLGVGGTTRHELVGPIQDRERAEAVPRCTRRLSVLPQATRMAQTASGGERAAASAFASPPATNTTASGRLESRRLSIEEGPEIISSTLAKRASTFGRVEGLRV